MKFQVQISRMFASSFEVEADSEEEAWREAEHTMNFKDTSDLQWETIRKSDVIDSIEPLD
jgi:hypothetical protein